jgi:hypothetical protein
MTATFPNTEAFYAADERRRRSGELDFGVWWRRNGLVFRVTWVEATGELIAVQLSGPRVEALLEPGSVRPAGFMVIGGDPDNLTVIGTVRERAVVERLLDGWAEMCGEQESLGWVLDRVRSCGYDGGPDECP